MASGELEHTLLPKVVALPVFSSDPLSSNAYATQEILLVLGTVGTASALNLLVPISVAVAALLVVVVTSYRQTVRAYPTGGGAYRVSSENLGTYAGLLAASALLLDYVLTVSVSITAGVDAIVSAAAGFVDFKILIAIAFILFVTLVNLRGVRESGTFFAIPTYGFILMIYLMLSTGFVKCLAECPKAESAGMDPSETGTALTLFLVLKAFAAGTTALTGVEAIADGVQAFRYPQSKNAATTLAVMGGLSISMFLGISLLADHTGVVYKHEDRTVVAQIGRAIFGDGPLFYLLQFMTAGILILAANTAYQDFPRLSSILAQDRFMPRQFMNRGDRLVFSNGVFILATLSSLLIWAFNADLNRLIQLYLVGVFISFTLSQSGMVLHWRKVKGRNWKRSAAINAVGAVVTGTVFFVIVTTKFLGGAWIVVCAIPIVMFLMKSVNRHYTDVAHELAEPERRPADRRPGHQHMVILVNEVNAATARAVGYVRSVRPAEASAMTFDSACIDAWTQLAPDIPVSTAERHGSMASSVRDFLRAKRAGLEQDDFLTLIIPEVFASRSLLEVFSRPGMYRLKTLLRVEPGVQVMNIVAREKDETKSIVEEAHEPARNYVCILVSGVHNATLQAIEYAETLQPIDIRAVSFGLDPAATQRLGDRWIAARIPHPLEIEDSPFRDIGRSLVQYLRPFKPDGVSCVVTVVLPEFVVEKRRHNVLHGQTALIVKRHLIVEPGMIVVSVPYHLKPQQQQQDAAR